MEQIPAVRKVSERPGNKPWLAAPLERRLAVIKPLMTGRDEMFTVGTSKEFVVCILRVLRLGIFSRENWRTGGVFYEFCSRLEGHFVFTPF